MAAETPNSNAKKKETLCGIHHLQQFLFMLHGAIHNTQQNGSKSSAHNINTFQLQKDGDLCTNMQIMLLPCAPVTLHLLLIVWSKTADGAVLKPPIEQYPAVKNKVQYRILFSHAKINIQCLWMTAIVVTSRAQVASLAEQQNT